ncbi:MAG: hypothetical protein E6H63_06100 [Betaproteobacteria bacterium]|nr:MAG: hypothetical protein E6H63_06100 [Betaproteobacteria bacterium]
MEPTARRQAPSLGQVVARLIGEARQLASDYAERMSAKGEEWMAMPQDWMETARDYVREKPFQALGIALAAGYLLHLITSRD